MLPEDKNKPQSRRKLVTKLKDINQDTQMPKISLNNQFEAKKNPPNNMQNPSLYKAGHQTLQEYKQQQETIQIANQLNDFKQEILLKFSNLTRNFDNKLQTINSQESQNFNQKIVKNDDQDNKKAQELVLINMQKQLSEQEFKIERLSQHNQNLERQYFQKSMNADQQSQNSEMLQQFQSNQNTTFQVQTIQNQLEEIKNRIKLENQDLKLQLTKQKVFLQEENAVIKNQIFVLQKNKNSNLSTGIDQFQQQFIKLENQLKSEIQNRIQKEFDNINLVDQKLNIFKDEIRSDEKQILMGEQKFVKQIQESILALNKIIKLTKDELESNLQATQALFGENIKNLKQNQDQMKQNLELKYEIVEKQQSQIQIKLGDINLLVQDNIKYVNSMIQQSNTQQHVNHQELKEFLTCNNEQQNLFLKEQQQQIQQWQQDFENKNFKVFNEISNALKALKQELNAFKIQTSEKFSDQKVIIDENQVQNNKRFENVDILSLNRQQQWEYQFKQQQQLHQENIDNLRTEFVNQIKMSENYSISTAREQAQQLIDSNSLMTKEWCNGEIQQQNVEITTELTNLIDNQISNLQVQNVQFQDKFQVFSQKVEFIQQDQVNIQTQLKEMINMKEKNLQTQIIDNQNYVKDILVNQLQEKYQKDIKDQIELVIKSQDLCNAKQEEQFSSQIQKLQQKLQIEIKDQNQQTIQEIYNQIQTKYLEEFKSQVQKETNERNNQLQVVHKNLQSTKTLILENIQQQLESYKSLIKSLIQEEQAERMKNDLNGQFYCDQQINQLQTKLDKQFEQQIQDAKYEMSQRISQINDQLNDFKTFSFKEFQKFMQEVNQLQIDQSSSQQMQNIQIKLLSENLKKVLDKIQQEMQSIEIKQLEQNKQINLFLQEQDQQYQEQFELLLSQVQSNEEICQQKSAENKDQIVQLNELLEENKDVINNNIETKNNHLRNELNVSMDSTKETIQSDLNQFKGLTQNEIDSINQSVENVQKENIKLEQHQKELMQQFENIVREEVQGNKEELQQTNNKISIIEDQIKGQQEQSQKLEKQNDNLFENVEKIRQELKETQESQIKTKELLEQQKEAISDVQSKLNEMDNTIETINNDQNQNNNKIDEFKQSLTESENEVKNIKQNQEDCKKLLEKVEQEIDQTKMKMDQYDQIFDDVNESIKKEVNILNDKIKSNSDKIEKIYDTQLEDKIQRLDKEIEDLKSEDKDTGLVKTELQKIQPKLQEQDQQIKELQELQKNIENKQLVQEQKLTALEEQIKQQ